METKINVAEILKDKPKGTKLYSSACGKCELKQADDKSFKVSFYSSKFGFMNGGEGYLDINGKLYDDGECVVFPSKEMRDWSKFAWKKGDILVNKDAKVHIIFDGFEDDTYKNFHGQYYLWEEGGSIVSFEEDENDMQTSDFNKANKEDAQEYIHKIEKELGGKLNMETLEIEKPQPEFKNGDIVALVVRKCTHIAIFQSRQEAYIGFHAVLCQNDELLLEEPFREDVGDIELRPATDSEKQQLFDALAKKGKAWNAEKKQIVALKPKIELKPFDKVLSRRCSEDYWVLNFYSHKSHKTDYHICIDGSSNLYCIPYNEETVHLLGTTDDWEGGEA